MQELARFLVVLATFNQELLVLHRHLDIAARKARHGKRDAQSLRSVRGRCDSLDVVRWVAVACGLGDPVESSLDLVESKHERRRQTVLTRHHPSPFLAPIAAALVSSDAEPDSWRSMPQNSHGSWCEPDQEGSFRH